MFYKVHSWSNIQSASRDQLGAMVKMVNNKENVFLNRTHNTNKELFPLPTTFPPWESLIQGDNNRIPWETVVCMIFQGTIIPIPF